MIDLYFDGGCWPNPGTQGKSGTIIYLDGRVIYKDSNIIQDERVTNNLMEYDGLYQGLIYLRNNLYNVGTINVFGDSLMVIKQCKKRLSNLKQDKPHKTYKSYKRIAFKVKDILNDFSDISFNWIPREQNMEADLLTQQ